MTANLVVRYAVGLLPCGILLYMRTNVCGHIAVENIERKLARFAVECGTFPEESGAVMAMFREFRKKLGPAWICATKFPKHHTPAFGVTLFYEENGEWKPGTTYHFTSARAAA
jgi:hypothetical protein